MNRRGALLLVLLAACGSPTPQAAGPIVRGTVTSGGDPFEGVRVRAEGIVVVGKGAPRTVPAGEAVSAKDGSFAIALSPDCVAAFRSRTSWGWSLALRAEHPECFRAIVTPSHIDTLEELTGVTVAFPDVQEDIAAEMKTLFEGFRKHPARTEARYGLDPAEWGPLQKLFDAVVDAVGDRRAARTVVKTYEKDSDPHVRALAYEALGVVRDSEDDAGRPPGAKDAASARALLEWCARDVERSKHGGHYSMGVKLDDGCTRCYSRWEDALSALLELDRPQRIAFLADRKGLQGQVAVFHALLADEARRSSDRSDREKEEGPRGFVPDFDLTATLKPDEPVLVFTAGIQPRWVGPQRLDTPRSFMPDWFTLEEFAWSPDGKRLAGRGGAFQGRHREIWILDLEKGKASRATWGGDIDWRPAWFPDNNRLLFVRNGGKGQELWQLNASTYDARKVDSSEDWMDHYSLHPDGKRVVVASREGTASVLDLETGRKTPALADGGRVQFPAWSPSGNRIAFAREGMLHVADAGAATSRRLSAEGLKLGRLAWSPDGVWIAFSYSRGDDHAGLAVVKPDGTGFRELRKFGGWPGEDAPTWSADSRRVAFGGRALGGMRGELWIHTVEDGSVFRLLEGDAGHAAWRPVR